MQETNSEVALALAANNIELSEAQIADVRNGSDGGLDTTRLSALARHFHVHPDYLTTDSSHAVHQELLLIRTMTDRQVKGIYLRGLPADLDLGVIIDLIDNGAKDDNDRT